MQLLRRLKNKAGISLVEVIVALAVFMVGILSVVRMFPSGFIIVRQSENSTLAKRLAQAELERWKGMAANLPSGILPWAWNGAYYIEPDTDPLNLYNNLVVASPPAPVPEYYLTGINKFRRIIGEAVRIPIPSSGGSVYVLGFSPVDQTSTINVYSGPMRRLSLPRNLDYLVLRSSSDYVIDYENATVYVAPANYARTYIISYCYWNDPGGGADLELTSVVSQSITVTAATGGVDYQYIDLAVAGVMDRGSDSLHRAFTQQTLGVLWSSTDPYEFQVKDTAGGVLLFNPLGYEYDEVTARGKEPLKAYIDYTVLDWHIIRDERTVPPDNLAVKLSLRFIKESGVTVEPDGNTYGGLAPDPAFNLTCSVLVVDMETGDAYDESSGLFTVNYKDGVLKFDSGFIPSPSGRTFQIHYQAEDDWAVQPYKTFEVYRRSYVTTLSYQEYLLNTNGELGFARCYAGGTVAVDYTYKDSSNIEHNISGRTIQISEATGNFDLCYIDLLDGLPAGATITGVSKVYGVSLGARVIWRDSGRGLQAGRWKNVDLHTYLTRSNR